METVVAIVIYIIEVIICYLISGMVHELGHVLTGIANGWRFHLLVIGPLGIKADEQGKIKFYYEKQKMLWGGVGAAFPKVAKEENIKIWSRVLLGGPLASIVMGIIFLPLGQITGNMMLILLGAMPIGMGVACILPLPFKTGITYSDGKRWSRIHRGGQEAAEELALFRIVENEIVGGDFLNIDFESIKSLTDSKEIGIQYYGYYYRSKYHKARGEEEECEVILRKMEEMKSKVSPIVVKDCI